MQQSSRLTIFDLEAASGTRIICRIKKSCPLLVLLPVVAAAVVWLLWCLMFHNNNETMPGNGCQRVSKQEINKLFELRCCCCCCTIKFVASEKFLINVYFLPSSATTTHADGGVY